jgi:tetratricopeptide (TPR) repeat protein
VQYCAVGRFDDSIAALRTALRLSPDMRGLHALIALTLLLKGEHGAALGEAELERNAELRLARRALALHALGRKAESDAALRELEEKHADDSAWEIARVHAFRGEADRAFEWLDRALGLPTSAVYFSLNDPLLASLHDDPRWLPFLRKVGVAPEQVAAIRFDVKLPE